MRCCLRRTVHSFYSFNHYTSLPSFLLAVFCFFSVFLIHVYSRARWRAYACMHACVCVPQSIRWCLHAWHTIFPEPLLASQILVTQPTIFVDMLFLQSLLHLKNSACFLWYQSADYKDVRPAKFLPGNSRCMSMSFALACTQAQTHTPSNIQKTHRYPEFYAPFQKIQTCLCQPQPGRESRFFMG